MATLGSKNQPIVQTSDTFNPAADINTLANWVANNYASVKILTGSTVHTSLSGSDLFAGLLCYEQSTGQYWRYNGSGWLLEPIGDVPRIQLDRTSAGTGFFTSGTTTTISGWTATQNRGGFTESSGVVTVPFSGRYNISGFFGYNSNTSGYRVWQINCNGSSNQIFRNIWNPISGTSMGSVVASGVRLVAGDTVALQGLQSSGSTIDLFYQSGFRTNFTIEYVGA